jgi:hypothetical protein
MTTNRKQYGSTENRGIEKMMSNIKTDIEQRKFKSDLLHELDRIASALERLAQQWDQNEKELHLS